MILLHATAVALDGRAVLLTGPSGSGKSDLALRLIDRGWTLVGDDYVELEGGVVRPRDTIAGRIEVRGIGIVEVPHLAEAVVALHVDLATLPERMPEPATIELQGATLPTVSIAAFELSAAFKVELALKRTALALDLNAQ